MFRQRGLSRTRVLRTMCNEGKKLLRLYMYGTRYNRSNMSSLPPQHLVFTSESPNCKVVNPVTDHCGCGSGRSTVDCSSSPLHNIVGEGETCGGFMAYDMVGHCDDGLECVYNMGPMVADAPGICMQMCPTFRDTWGNCVDEGCNSWSDGCNTCDVNDNSLENCSENVCYMKPSVEAQCLDNIQTDDYIDIPENCLLWFDGCNICNVFNGLLGTCTMRYCFTQGDPFCQEYLNSELTQGDICYQFCEDNSQQMVDRSEDCPKGTECMPENIDMISYDSCGERAHRCIPTNSGH